MRKWGIGLLLVLLAVFSLQNLGMSRISFGIWELEAPRGLIYLAVFALGWIAGLLSRRRKHAPPSGGLE